MECIPNLHNLYVILYYLFTLALIKSIYLYIYIYEMTLLNIDLCIILNCTLSIT